MKKRKHPVEERYEIILDSIADGVFTVNLDFEITSFNRAAEVITGFSKQRALGKPSSKVLQANVCETGCFLKETLATERPIVNRPVFIRRSDGKRIPISSSTTLLKDRAGRVAGGVETFRDLSVVYQLKKAISRQHTFEDIVSKSEKMHRLFSILPQIAESSSTVLIEGGSGTGKELVARAIHNNSRKRKGPFVAVKIPLRRNPTPSKGKSRDNMAPLLPETARTSSPLGPLCNPHQNGI